MNGNVMLETMRHSVTAAPLYKQSHWSESTTITPRKCTGNVHSVIFYANHATWPIHADMTRKK